MASASRQDAIEKIAALVKDINIAMLVTIDGRGRPRSRPMGTQRAPFDGTLWFFTAKDSEKVAEIRRNPLVNVAYAATSDQSYLSVSGAADILDDREKIDELWNPLLRAWFDGPEDPRICLVRVDVQEAEFWDTPGGRVAALFSLVKGAITGDGENTNTDNRRVSLPANASTEDA